MILEATTLASGTVLRPRLCIIGAGPAGISLALQFRNTGIEVLLVAGGKRDHDAATQALYAGEIADAAMHSPVTEFRHRQLGGSSATWGGRSMPFDPIDFETRDWIAGARWPIGYDDVAPYYPAANALVEAGDFEYDARRALPGAMREMVTGFAPPSFDLDRIERFSCPTNFGTRYARQLETATNITLLLDAHAVEIAASDAGDRVARAVLRTLDGREFTVEADHHVIAAGGIETARLLLASRSAAHPQGLGNTRDLVGRNYLCHIAGTIGDVAFSGPRENIWHGYDRAWDGVYCRRRMALRPEVQREKGIANVVARLHHPRLPDPAHGRGILSAIFLAKPFISYEYSKRLHGGDRFTASLMLRHAFNIAREPLGTAGFLLNWARRRTLAARKFPSLIVAPRNNVFSLDIHAEQVPNEDSRVMLSGWLDAFGKPQVKVDWRYKPQDLETISIALQTLKAELAAWGGGSLTYDEDGIADAMLREGAYGGHHMGTARMGRNPEEGVVDGDGRVFGLDNLFLASAAIFPTSSQANPTLTIVAFALRLADHLKGKLTPSVPDVGTHAAGAGA